MNKPVALVLHLKSSIYNLKGYSALKYIEKELRHTSNFSNIHIIPIITNSATTLSLRSEQVEDGISSVYKKANNEKLSIIAYSFASLPVQNALSLKKSTLEKVDKLLFISSPLNGSKFCDTLNQTSPCFLYHKIVDGLQVDLTWLKEEYNKKSLKDPELNIATKYLSAKAFLPQFPLSYSQSKIHSCSDRKYYISDGVVSDSDMSKSGERDTISLPCSHYELFALSDNVNKQVFRFYNKYLNE